MWQAMRIPFPGRAFVDDRRANVAILFAVTMPMVIGGAGLGVETAYWYFRALRLQSATDAAAYAAGIEARAGSSKATMATAASAVVAQNGYDAAALNLQVIYPYVMPAGGSAVRVVITAPEERFFSKVLSEAPITITKASIARFETAASA